MDIQIKSVEMLIKAITKRCLLLLTALLCGNWLIAQSGMIDIEIDVVNPSACNVSDGIIYVTPISGIAPFEYSINGGASFQADSSFTGLSIGTYIVLVRDSQQQFSKFELAKLTAEGAPSIRGIVMSDPTECDKGGTLKILTEGGIGELQFSIDSGRTFQNTHIFEDVPSGFYHIVVRNQDESCPTTYPTVSFAPQSPDIFLNFQSTVNQPNCDSTDGVITVTVTGGSGDYLYSIDNGENFQLENTFNNLAEGTYQLVIRDTITKCQKAATEMVTLTEADCPSCDNLQIGIETVLPNCDSLNGQIELTVSGGSGQYEYSVDSGRTFQDSVLFTNLAEGEYTVIVKDLTLDCEKNADATVSLVAEDCPSCDSLDLQSFLVLPTCDSLNGQIELTISGGTGNYLVSLNGGDFVAATTYQGLGSGSYVFTVRDVDKGCEKTFSAINLTAEDCDCSLDLLAEQSLVAMADDCSTLATVCLSVSLETMMQLEILDNGNMYSGGLRGCDFDTMLSYLYFTLPGEGFMGPYTLNQWVFNDSTYTGSFADIDELVALMNTLDTNATWIRDSATMTIKGGFVGNDYGALDITQTNTNMKASFQLNLNALPMGSQLMLDTGRHELIFRDRNTSCKDTLVVEVACPECPPIAAFGTATVTVLDCDSLGTFCFSGIDSSGLDSYTILDNGMPYSGTLSDCEELVNGVEIALDTGAHELVFEDTTTNCRFTFSLQVNCQTETVTVDTTIFIGDMDTICMADLLMSSDDAELTPVCEGQSPAVGFDINNLTNCVSFEGIREGMDTLCLTVCEMDNTCKEVIITVTVVDTSMMMDSTCTIFPEANATVTVEDCDSMGQYCLNLSKDTLATYELFINGMLFTDNYLDCDVPENGSLRLPIGSYQLILRDSSCADTATLNIVCEDQTNEFFDTVLVNETDTFCLDGMGMGLMSDIDTIANICPENSGEMVLFEVNPMDICVYYTGIEAGVDSACIVVCDTLDNCDTMIVIITTEEMPDSILPPIAVNDIDTVEESKTKTINVLGNDTTNSTLITVTIIEAPINGTATVNADLTVNYTPDMDLCDTTDFFTYELCNPSGCDTARVDLYIKCKELVIFNGFSPNGDGVNETFTIDGIEDFPNNQLQIFNRWGNQVFEQQGYKGQWNGTWKDRLLPDGTYFYLLDDGEGTTYSGFLEIRR
ncbi:MAG: gliding motility-associated C-terminal domain-containing protein [Bacteroidota bacterium]